MCKIIIYGSKYGTTKMYAEELARRINVKAVPFDRVKDIDDYDTIIYLGALYAGGVLGMAKTLKKISDVSNKSFILATVGLADPTNNENTNNIKNSIKRQLTENIAAKTKFFHLRGGIDYSKLTFTHKTMMSMLYKKAKNMPEEKKTAEVRAMIDTYNKKVDFVDFSCLDIIVNEINV